MKTLKALFNIIINILIVLVLITSLLIAVMALTSKSSGISTIFGYTIQPIQSDSMKGGSPDGYGGKDFEKGDLMIAKATGFSNDAEYDMGDIITYRTEDTNGNPVLVSHRVVDVVTGRDGVTRYQTWGDNREMAQVPDQSDVNEYLVASDIGSLYYSKNYEGTILKGWGAPLDFIRTQQGFFFVVLLPMIIFFMYALVRVVLSATGYKKAKTEEESKWKHPGKHTKNCWRYLHDYTLHGYKPHLPGPGPVPGRAAAGFGAEGMLEKTVRGNLPMPGNTAGGSRAAASGYR